jgi:hypothetical protein
MHVRFKIVFGHMKLYAMVPGLMGREAAISYGTPRMTHSSAIFYRVISIF